MRVWLGFAIVVMTFGYSYANPEMTVALPGGATMEFVWIEPGTFMMGSADNDPFARDNERPQHQVTITRGFWLGKYEITQGQWTAVMGSQAWTGHPDVNTAPDRPAVYIKLSDLRQFVHALFMAAAVSETQGDSLYRLPTEAEWEYACRAGTTTAWSFGDDPAQVWNYAWYYDEDYPDRFVGSEGARPGGLKSPNPWGLYDMHGNVFEWVDDGYTQYSSDAQIDPVVKAWWERGGLVRGGGFLWGWSNTRSAARSIDFPPSLPRSVQIGGRLVRLEKPVTVIAPGTWGQIKNGD